MVAITLRADLTRGLTNEEIDANMTNLKAAAEAAALTASWAGVTGKPATLAGYGITDAQPLLVSGTSIKTVNGESVLGSGNIQIDGGVTSFNTRTGAVTLGSSDVTTALGYTPYNATNPSGFISGINSSMVTTALGFTPANKAGDTFTGNVLVNSGADSRFLVQSSGVTQGQLQATATVVRLASNNTLPLSLSTSGVDRLTFESNGQTSFNSNVFLGIGGAASTTARLRVLGTGLSSEVARFENGTTGSTLLINQTDDWSVNSNRAGISFRKNNVEGGAFSVEYNGTRGIVYYDAVGATGAHAFYINSVDRLRLNASGAMSFSGAGYGTAGQFLKTSGTSAAPIWSSLASSDVTGALGFTPYNSTNPSGYITSSALSSYLPLSGGTVSGAMAINSGGAYTLELSSSQRYQLRLRNTAASAQTAGWWFAHDAGGNLVIHADSVADRWSLDSSGHMTMSGRVRMGTFSSSTSNTGEAWIGRASDRATGTMTVQLGNSADRVFEVVDSPWSTVIFAAGMNSFTYKGSAILHAGNVSSYAAPVSHTHSYLPLSGGTVNGVVRVNSQLQVGQNTNGTAIIDAFSGIARFGRDNTAYGLQLDGNNYASFVNANGYVNIGPLNSSHSHFQTDRPSFYFNKDVLVDGQLYRYSGNLPYLHSGNYNNYSPTLTGGNASGTWGINITGNAGSVNSKTSTAFHQRVHYGTSAGNSGFYKIRILAATSWMLSFTIRIYQGYQSHDIRVSGYNYGGNYWYSPQASLMDSSATSIDVRFGYDSAYNLWVAVPADVYTGLDVLDVVNGYTQIDGNYADQFAIQHQTSLTGTVQTVVTAYRPLKYNETATAANLLNLGAHTISSSSWAGGGGYHGYQFNGGNWRFGFSSTGGVVDVYADGNFYATDSSHLVLHAGNYTSYSPSLTGSGASGTWSINITGNAGSLQGYQWNSSGKDIRGSDIYADSWLRNYNSGTGLYNQATGNHWYSDGQYWNVGYSGTTGIRLRNGHAGTILGYLYAETSANFGLLNSSGNWAVQVYPGGTGGGYLHGTWNGGNIRANRANGNLYIDDNFGCGVVGNYSASRYQGVFFMGDSYKMSADGTSLANMYGIGWSHPNAGGAAGNLTDHGMLIINNGSFRCAISNSIVASGNITAYSDERLKTNWRDLPENFVARLAKVKVGIYDRLDEENVTQVGVSAQSFQQLLPQAIMTAKDEMSTLSVSYGNAALASAVELAKDNVELRARIERLEALVEKLIGD